MHIHLWNSSFQAWLAHKKFYNLCYSLTDDDCILFAVQGSKILMTEADLNGTWRVAVDGMATEKECKMLIKLAEVCSLFLLNVHGWI